MVIRNSDAAGMILKGVIAQRNFVGSPALIESFQRSHGIDNRHPVSSDLPENRETTILVVKLSAIVRQVEKPLARGTVRITANFRHCNSAATVGKHRLINHSFELLYGV